MSPRIVCAGVLGVLALVAAALSISQGVAHAWTPRSFVPFAGFSIALGMWGVLAWFGVGRSFAAADRVQNSRRFKIIASGVVVLATLAGVGSYTVARTAPGASAAGAPTEVPDEAAASLTPEQVEALEVSLKAVDRIRKRIVSARESTTMMAAAIGAAGAVALVIVWIGLALTYVMIGATALLVGVPAAMLGGDDATWLVLGIVWLTAAFTALMRGLSLLLSGPGPVLAVARNVLAEAARMRLSLVLIVMLILGLSLLPTLLKEDVFLRYRVQTFLQYSVAGSFWIMAILTLFFGVATVAFEQRDRLIWQTMTKPVAAWEYLLGKWVGLAGLNLVLLAVSATAIFIFVEYLRAQPAGGESRGRASLIDSEQSQDRRILETQVLAARVEVEHTPPVSPDDPDFLAAVQAYVDEQKRAEPTFDDSPRNLARVREELLKSALRNARSIPPDSNPSAAARVFEFRGLERARELNEPLTLHYRIDAGSNMPDELYRLTFELPGGGNPITRDTGLGQKHSFAATPFLFDEMGETVLVSEVPPSAAEAAIRRGFPLITTRQTIDEAGTLYVLVYNGRFLGTSEGLAFQPNRDIANIPEGGFNVSYEAASFHSNFVRVMAVLWLKLAFLAMISIAASTFLSFPVACLVAFGTFLLAEGSGFLERALEYYGTTDRLGELQIDQAIIYGIGRAVVGTFGTYADLRPTTRLVEGRLVEWSSLGSGAGVLAVWSLALYALAVAIFRRRELATYSGR